MLLKLKLLLLFILCGNAYVFANSNTLPDIGSSTNKILSVTKEQQIGDVLFRQLKGKAPILHDILATNYLRTIGFKIVANNSDAMNRKFDFFLIDSPDINAFAMPGGYIAVHTGLILKADTEDQLAGVLAHEIAHVTQRHLARRYERSSQLSIPTMIGMFATLIAATQSNNSDTAIGGLSAIMAGSKQILINYTRANEAEADRIGIQSLSNAGYNPNGMAEFFDKLLQESGHRKDSLPFLRTHPVSAKRQAEARNRALNLTRHKNHDRTRFWIIKERIRALAQNDKNILNDKVYKKLLADSTGALHDAILHGYSLWLSRHGNAEQAVSIAKDLVKRNPKSILHTALLADTLIRNNQPQLAKQLLTKFLSKTPLNFPTTMLLAKAELKLGQFKKARNLYLSMAYQHSDESELFKSLAVAQAKSGMEDESRESQGQYLYSIGDIDGALMQYKLALNGRSDDPYFNSRVRARIISLERELLQVRGQSRRKGKSHRLVGVK